MVIIGAQVESGLTATQVGMQNVHNFSVCEMYQCKKYQDKYRLLKSFKNIPEALVRKFGYVARLP